RLLLATPRRPRTATLFPYTTLFRSPAKGVRLPARAGPGRGLVVSVACGAHHLREEGGWSWPCRSRKHPFLPASAPRSGPRPWSRSEEHTSELQSRENLVCRLLLEKK